MNQKSFLFGLAGLAIILVIVLFFVSQDNKIHLDQKYVLGQKTCDAAICVTPLSISSDRATAHLLVYAKDTNQTCIQDINNGVMVPIQFYDCRMGSDWNGWEGTKFPAGITV